MQGFYLLWLSCFVIFAKVSIRRLNHNQLTGTIPSTIDLMTSLNNVYEPFFFHSSSIVDHALIYHIINYFSFHFLNRNLNDNELTGTIPPWICDGNLTIFYSYNNPWICPLPSCCLLGERSNFSCGRCFKQFSFQNNKMK